MPSDPERFVSRRENEPENSSTGPIIDLEGNREIPQRNNQEFLFLDSPSSRQLRLSRKGSSKRIRRTQPKSQDKIRIEDLSKYRSPGSLKRNSKLSFQELGSPQVHQLQQQPFHQQEQVDSPLSEKSQPEYEKQTLESYNQAISENFQRPVPVQTVDTNFAGDDGSFGWWTTFSRAVTCCFFPWCLSRFGKMTSPEVQQAWREKMALIFIIFTCCLMLGFITFGLQAAICAPSNGVVRLDAPPEENAYAIRGKWYLFEKSFLSESHPNSTLAGAKTREISALFANTFETPNCNNDLLQGNPPNRPCKVEGAPEHCHSISFAEIQSALTPSIVAIDWSDISAEGEVSSAPKYVVYNGDVLDVSSYVNSDSKYFPENLDSIIRQNLGKDITRKVFASDETIQTVKCAVDLYKIGELSQSSAGCFASTVISNMILTIILSLVFLRFGMALTYSWFVAPRLTKEPSHRRNARKFAQMNGDSEKEGFNIDQLVKSENNQKRRTLFAPAVSRFSAVNRATVFDDTPSHISNRLAALPAAASSGQKTSGSSGNISLVDLLPYVMLLVTCYNEGESGLRATLESLCATEYHDRHKLLVVIADGKVETDDGRCTADICRDMMELEPLSVKAKPKSYVAVAQGYKQHNMATVYAGYFNHQGHSTPIILVAKCGTPEESDEKKPGNRGKRDSQIILMNFLGKVMFDDRLTELEFDLFTKIHRISGVTPDNYEMLLMVDADTVVMPDSLGLLVNTFENDNTVVGLCGETRISNKLSSWVTAIQVYEYYISHHLSKSFESLFGSVTCLPGCFCMYRIKARKGNDGYWVPLLCNPDIVQAYSQNEVDSLHKKNLLMLGEDRFLSTLMLKAFPKRKMLFVPQAACKTEVPEKLKVLMSQRRRWINSTVHNLMELVLVPDLCGLFCFSMNFVILLDLIGTVVLPAAIIFTGVLIYSIATPANSFVEDSLFMLVLLLSILVLPAFLIVLTTVNRPVYIGYMFIYLLALPVWNFLLPVYAFWHFDDFSWGATRAVKGEANDKGHGGAEGEFNFRAIRMRRWEEWAKENRSKNTYQKPKIQSKESREQKNLPKPPATSNNQPQKPPSRRNTQLLENLMGEKIPPFIESPLETTNEPKISPLETRLAQLPEIGKEDSLMNSFMSDQSLSHRTAKKPSPFRRIDQALSPNSPNSKLKFQALASNQSISIMDKVLPPEPIVKYEVDKEGRIKRHK